MPFIIKKHPILYFFSVKYMRVLLFVGFATFLLVLIVKNGFAETHFLLNQQSGDIEAVVDFFKF